ncbi:malonate decarboxylase holo-[acyl-carrier-protein] synthase [Undibacterium sp. CY7W]|uniref:Malonate decarboxylase holo-[acyl-carrier-protein] synthase n=1 Tax=Undibacterium rugosum TaxID=2762291 RepID=A0A923I2W8_9BURK|nr:malonate decarboxylase holo-[acyl-carrier-protein] synthase [Undibacterium rugosum]MBC3936691.1 malonate decarboxylase holo-[acyl-carrier-protein] synthase [Undibacterium rugosum]
MSTYVEQVEQFQRHDLVWLSHQAWEMLAMAQSPVWLHAVRDWQQQEWPAVVRRRDSDAAESELCIGLELPPQDGQRRRLATRVSVEHVIEHQSGLALNTVLPLALPEWQNDLRALQQDAAAHGLRFRVYGALSWQFLTGQPHLQNVSPIDLLFRPASQRQLQLILQLLSCFQQRLPLDGEILFPQGQAVSWRAWNLADSAGDVQQEQKVLVKDQMGARLCSQRDMLALLAQSA